MKTNLLAFLISLIVAFLISPLVVFLSKKLKASQTILEYVKEHQNKSNTPTLGGIIFIVASFVSLCFFNANYTLALLSLAVMLGYGILGFLDDFIKIKFKQNLGLRPYQKIIGQVGIAAIVAVFCYNSGLVGTNVYIPFVKTTINLGWAIIPFIIFVYLSVTNSVNLTDGLDGLASGVTLAYLMGFILVLTLYQNLTAGAVYDEYQNIIILCFCLIGAILGFLFQNVYPAKIFMGDTGSLALGGVISSIAIFTKLELFIPFLGIMFVLSAVSVIIQVLHFKRTKRRIFKMAPIHHHFQMSGVNENRITFVYILITLAISAIAVLICMFASGM